MVRWEKHWRRPIFRQVSGVLGNQRGSTILEFAILAAPLIALILAIIETSLVFFTQQGIDTATEVAARSILTGSAQTAQLTQAQFKQAACAALPPYLSCSKLSVDVQTASSFAAANVGSPKLTYDNNGNLTNNFTYSTGGAGDIVVVRLIYLWPVSKGPLGFDLSNQPGSQRLLIGTSVAKTESYQS